MSSNPFESAIQEVKKASSQSDTTGLAIRLKIAAALSALSVVIHLLYLFLVIRDTKRRSSNPFWVYKMVSKTGIEGRYLLINTKPVYGLLVSIIFSALIWRFVTVTHTITQGISREFMVAWGIAIWITLAGTWIWLFSVFQSFLILGLNDANNPTNWVGKIKPRFMNMIFLIGAFLTIVGTPVPIAITWVYSFKSLRMRDQLLRLLEEGSSIYANTTMNAIERGVTLLRMQEQAVLLRNDTTAATNDTSRAISALCAFCVPFVFIFLLLGFQCISLLQSLRTRIGHACLDLTETMNLHGVDSKSGAVFTSQVQLASGSTTTMVDTYPPPTVTLPSDAYQEAAIFPNQPSFNHPSFTNYKPKTPSHVELLSKDECLALLSLHSDKPLIASKINRIQGLRQTMLEFTTFIAGQTLIAAIYVAIFTQSAVTYAKGDGLGTSIRGVRYELTTLLGAYVFILAFLPSTSYLTYLLLKKEFGSSFGSHSKNGHSSKPSDSERVHQVNLYQVQMGSAPLGTGAHNPNPKSDVDSKNSYRDRSKLRSGLPFTTLEADGDAEDDSSEGRVGPSLPNAGGVGGINGIQVHVIQEVVVLEDRDAREI